MESPTKHVEVLIVGAGVSGLMMAAQLLRYGIQPMVIDRRSGLEKKTRAFMLHARSMEIFRQMGMADGLVGAGVACYAAQLTTQSETVAGIDFSQMDDLHTPFPFMLGIGQDKVEKQLIDRLTEKACPVLWETNLVAIHQDDHLARVELVRQAIPQTWHCRWVVAADGADSDVRGLLDIPTENEGPKKHFFMADVDIRGTSGRSIFLSLSKSRFAGLFPLDTGGRYRLVFLASKREENEETELIAIKSAIDQALGFELPVYAWLSTGSFVSQRRIAAQFTKQRCFLIGDAAHAYSPIGALGINMGLHDAANLGWKLAGVIKDNIGVRVLHSYQEERYKIAKDTLFHLDRLFDRMAGNTLVRRLLRSNLFGKGITYFAKRKNKMPWLFDRIAHLHIHYRRSSLSAQHASNRQVRAGDRVPFLTVYDEKTKTETDLHRWCQNPGFTLLVLGTVSHHQLHLIGRWMKQKYPREMYLYYLPYSVRNQPVFDAFESAPGEAKLILIRPDMYIAYINGMLNVNSIDTYMEEVIGWK